MKISYFKSLRFKLMLLVVLTGVTVSFGCIGASVYMTNHIREIAQAAYTAAAAGADSALLQALNSVHLDLRWMTLQWVIVWIVIFSCLFPPVTMNIKNIIMPLRQVAGYADDLAKGDINVEVTQNREDEIGLILDSFKKLVEMHQLQASMIQRVSEGDLTVDVVILSDKDVVGHALEKMVSNLNTLFSEIGSSTVQVSSAAKQIADGAQTLAQGATEQAASVEELSSSFAEINQMAKDNSTSAIAALEEVQGAGQLMGVCMEQMGHMLAAMKMIDEKSRDIVKTTNVIDDIAFQTNILALNAAVDAARAGQHGKGFAVVAEEVRNLASKSAEAAKEIAMLLESSSRSVEEGNRIVGQVNESLQSVVDISQKNAEHIASVQSISARQSTSMEQVTAGIDQVAQVIQQTSATSEESAAASQEMSGQSAMLQSMIARFKVKGGVSQYNQGYASSLSAVNDGYRSYGAQAGMGYDYSDEEDYSKY